MAADESSLGPCTLRQILTDAIDITTPPRKAVLRALAEYPVSLASPINSLMEKQVRNRSER